MSATTAVKKTTKTYTYRTGAGGNTNTDVSIEYSADLSALSRLEVSIGWKIYVKFVLIKKKIIKSDEEKL